jgi:UDP-N-acetylglucosamine diphosphorylase/glucosamine-1-phosphate N-acetyltransferase
MVMENKVGVIILAAGMGKRMKSEKAKVLHEVAGRPMIDYIVETAVRVAGANVVVVVGHQAETVREMVNRSHNVYFAIQPEQLGTGHAVMCGLPSMPGEVTSIVVLCGDVPLIQVETIEQLIGDHRSNSRDITILATRLDDPTGYGRLVMEKTGRLTAIVEQADADEAQQKIDIINTGFMVIEKTFLEEALPQLRAENAQNEIYLTDIIGIGSRQNRVIGAMIGQNPEQYTGINSIADLRKVEKTMKIMSCEKS